jgi:hypothetical protein
VGGVSERAGVKAGGSDPFARTNSFACRGGERHPDLLEGGALRGATSERGSWSVRSRAVVSSTVSRRADDRGCPKGAEEGNVVSMRHKAHAPRDAREIVPSLGDASFTRSGGPCTSILTTHHSASCGGGANERASRLGKPGQPGITSTGAFPVGRSAARHMSPLPQGRKRGMVKKRKEVEASVPARIKSSGLVARTSIVSCRSR